MAMCGLRGRRKWRLNDRHASTDGLLKKVGDMMTQYDETNNDVTLTLRA